VTIEDKRDSRDKHLLQGIYRILRFDNLKISETWYENNDTFFWKKSI